MPKPIREDGPADDGPRRLLRLLDRPDLARLAPHLAPEVVHRLIRHAGLETCVDLVEASTPEQLAAILDLDLWRAPGPGGDEELDADRFVHWVETLVDRDAATAARVIAAVDRSLAVTALSQYIRVLDPGVLEPTEASDDERPDVGLFATEGLTAELGGYLVQARREDAWDAILGLLGELSDADAERFHDLMAGCRSLSHAGREVDGLDDLFEAPEQLLHEATVDRGDRREGRGFISAGDARAFLTLARQRRPSSPANPIAAAWMRDASRPPEAEPPAAPARLDPAEWEVLDEITHVLEAEGMLPERRPALLGAGPEDGGGSSGLQASMEYLRDRHPDLCLDRGRELAFLANALVAGCRVHSRAFTPREATQAVAATCSLGLLRQPVPPGVDYLVGHDLIALFEDGWAALHREVSRFVAEGLLAALRDVRPGDADTLDGLRALRRSLETHLAAGTPWLARGDLDVLAALDMPACYGLRGLLGECPVLPGVVTGIVERRTGRIDPDAFAFIASDADLAAVRAFTARLPELLSE
jgi:hypothetical protein